MAFHTIDNEGMVNSSTYKLEIKSPNPAAYTLNSVVGAPRTSSPLDVAAACKNIEIEADGSLVPPLIVACTQYLLTDFFALLHRTGLYNRQRQLWEALGRVAVVEVNRQQQGLFSRTDLPCLDFYFHDSRGRTALFGHLVEEEAFSSGFLDDERKQKEHLKGLLIRAEKIKNSKGPIAGILLFCPAEFPKIVLTKVLELTGGSDPVGRYESLLPEPLAVAIDLLEYTALDENAQTYSLKLAHPDLSASVRGKK